MILRVLLFSALLASISEQRVMRERHKRQIYRGIADQVGPEGAGALFVIFTRIFGNLETLNTFHQEDPFVAKYRVTNMETFPINWYHKIPVWELTPQAANTNIDRTLFANNARAGNVANAPAYTTALTGPFNDPTAGLGNIPLQPALRSLPIDGRRKKRQAEGPPEDDDESLGGAAGGAGLSSKKFTAEELRQIEAARQREQQERILRAQQEAEAKERANLQAYIDSLSGKPTQGATNQGQPNQPAPYSYNPACLRHFRGPYDHPQFTNGVFIDACNQPIPSEYILGARPDNDAEDLFGPLVSQQAGFDFQGRPIPQPERIPSLDKTDTGTLGSAPDPFGQIQTNRQVSGVDNDPNRKPGLTPQNLQQLFRMMTPVGEDPFAFFRKRGLPGGAGGLLGGLGK